MNEEKYHNSSRRRPDPIEQGGRGTYCCIPGCGSAFYDNQNRKTGITLFLLPKDKGQKLLWKRAINNVRRKGPGDDFEINDTTRVCEFHFKTEDIKVSINTGRKNIRDKTVVPVFKKKDEKPSTSRKPPKERHSIEPLESAMASCTMEPPEEPPLSEVDLLKQEIATLKEENLSLKNEVENLVSKLNNSDSKRYNFENIYSNKKFFKSETGLETDSFDELYDFLNPGENCANVKMYDSKTKKTQDKNDFVWMPPETKEKETSGKKQGPAKLKMNAKNQLFLYLTWLKGGFSINHASWLFDLPKSTVSRYIITWSNFLYFSLGAVPIWPSRQIIDKTMPVFFKETYPKTRCIIDCTELFCQRPSSLASQSHMYSNYKSHVTYKGLIGIAPSGSITFVSQLYEGCISDKEIVKRSGFLTKELWKKDDSVMADRGFTIAEDLRKLDVSLNIPAFLEQRDQFTKEEVEESQTIASVRIHVERAIQRVKKFRQIRNEINLCLHGSINQIWTVACLLCNFMPPLIQKDLPKETDNESS